MQIKTKADTFWPYEPHKAAQYVPCFTLRQTWRSKTRMQIKTFSRALKCLYKYGYVHFHSPGHQVGGGAGGGGEEEGRHEARGRREGDHPAGHTRVLTICMINQKNIVKL